MPQESVTAYLGSSSDPILAPLAPAYSVGKSAGGLANSAMTDAKRAALSVEDPVYRFSYISILFSTLGKFAGYQYKLW